MRIQNTRNVLSWSRKVSLRYLYRLGGKQRIKNRVALRQFVPKNNPQYFERFDHIVLWWARRGIILCITGAIVPTCPESEADRKRENAEEGNSRK